MGGIYQGGGVMPKYRFTQSAYFEQDIEADDLEQAYEIAKDEWDKVFPSNVFGGPEFEEVVVD